MGFAPLAVDPKSWLSAQSAVYTPGRLDAQLARKPNSRSTTSASKSSKWMISISV